MIFIQKQSARRNKKTVARGTTVYLCFSGSTAFSRSQYIVSVFPTLNYSISNTNRRHTDLPLYTPPWQILRIQALEVEAADRCAETRTRARGEGRGGRTGKRELPSGRVHLSATLVLLQSRRSEPDRTGVLSPLRSQQPGPNPKGSGSGHGTPPPGPRPRGELAVPPPRRPPAEAKFPRLPLFPGRGGGRGALGPPGPGPPHGAVCTWR